MSVPGSRRTAVARMTTVAVCVAAVPTGFLAAEALLPEPGSVSAVATGALVGASGGASASTGAAGRGAAAKPGGADLAASLDRSVHVLPTAAPLPAGSAPVGSLPGSAIPAGSAPAGSVGAGPIGAGPAPASAAAPTSPASAAAAAGASTAPAAVPTGVPAAAPTSSVAPDSLPVVTTGMVTTDPRVDASILALLSAQATPAAAPNTTAASVSPSTPAASNVASSSGAGGAGPVVSLSAGGWHSGASGSAARSGAFGTWRGTPIQATAIWGDTTAQAQTDISALDEWSGFNGDIDIAVGALAPGETWAQAATGAYASRWRQAVRSIAARRAGKGGTTYLRFAHELNGDWFTWKVNSSNLGAFKTSWKLYHDILAQEFPAAKLVFSPNNGNHSDLTVTQIYPGDDLVDVIGVDYYDGWPSILDKATWDRELNRTEAGDQPYGVGAWQRFAAAHGKPLSFPEWGLQMGDHPAFISGMHDFLVANAAQPGASAAGKVVYDVYFDIAHGGNTGFMLSGSTNPNAAALYRSLHWGS